MTQAAPVMNKQLVLIGGESSAGKSLSLMNMRNQERGVYLNTEAGKELPFNAKFFPIVVTDPQQVLDVFDELAPGGSVHDDFDYVMIDSLTFLMDMYESTKVIGSSNTMKAWGDYQQYMKELMQQKVAASPKAVIFTAHVHKEPIEKGPIIEYETKVPVKGALAKNGVEAFFSTVVHAKRMKMKDLQPYIEAQAKLPEEQRLLRITEDNIEDGFKHVFQTRVTKDTTGDRIRSPFGLFSRAQTFMDNDSQLLLDHLNLFYKK